MILKEYSHIRANKLSKLPIPSIKEPFEINFLWLQHEDFNNISSTFNNKLHKHGFYELHFILDGENIITDNNGKSFTVKLGEFIILTPNTPHSSKDLKGNSKRCSLAFSIVKNTDIDNFLSKLNFFVCRLSEKMLNNLNDIFSESERYTSLSTYIVRNRLFEIISDLLILGKYDGIFSDGILSNNLVVYKLKNYVKDNLNLNLTCKDVADYCNLNEIYLNRIFKKYTGETLLKYIHRKKVECAQNLLKRNELTLSMVSNMLGFQNEYYFNTFFKREVGMSPGIYKKRTQSNTDS